MGRRVVMSEDAIQNYGERWRGVVLEVTDTARRHMPAEEFFRKGQPNGYHPGFDPSSESPLYDLKRVDTGEGLGMSLYGWENQEPPKAAPKPTGETVEDEQTPVPGF